jgi:hypothetical protein
MGKWSGMFEVRLETMRDPASPLSMKLQGESVFLCPFVVGPEEFNRPFGLVTRYGYMVFVFVPEGPLFELFKNISAESLAEGYEMKSVILLAETEKQLRDAIALRLPLDLPFRMVLEGTDDFDRYMRELVEGTIWPDYGPADAGGSPGQTEKG